MRKDDLDTFISSYMKPIFGFALNRTNNRQEAEDLAQDIVFQVIKSVKSGVHIVNRDAYVWKVARHVWINWVKRKTAGFQIVDVDGISGLVSDYSSDALADLVDEETAGNVRREISRLAEIQRRIVVMYYFNNLKQTDIAKTLRVPIGTVKWHLHSAKNEIEKGLGVVRKTGELSYNPIKLDGMAHYGLPGNLGDTSNFLRRSIAQNIVYAAYRRPMTVNEIADELGAPPPFIEDEVIFLHEYDYLIDTGSGRYLSNVILWDETPEQKAEKHRLFQDCAARIADKHFDALMDMRKPIEDSSFYYPDKDYNFLLWSLLPKSIEEQGQHTGLYSALEYENTVPIRKDGGRYIAAAKIRRVDRPETDYEIYSHCGPKVRGRDQLYFWQLDTFWSERRGWRDLSLQDIELCHAYWSGRLANIGSHEDEYAFLLRKGYIRRGADGRFNFNALWINSKDEARRIGSLLPDLTPEYREIISTLYEGGLAIAMRNQPEHMRRQISLVTKLDTATSTLIVYILKHLIENGKLKEPKVEQRKTLTTFMGLGGS